MYSMRRKDEMEQNIANKAVKITWFVTIMTMFTIGGIKYFREGMEQNGFLVIASLSVSLLILLEQYYLSKINENSTFKKTIALVLIILVILLAITWFLSL